MPMFTTRPELRGSFGMAASTHWLATGVAMSVLERGGNAFDAAVAAGFTLQVVEPHLNGPAGEVPIIFQAAGGTPTVVCGQGPAPAAATPDAFAGLDRIPGSGVLPACVPGAFDAWLLLARDHGTLPLRDLLEPAIGYARRGYPLTPHIVGHVTAVEQVFTRHWPSSAALWLSGGAPPAADSLHTNPALADTYERVLTEAEAAGSTREQRIDAARRIWREGFVAEAIAEFCAQPRPDGAGVPRRALLSADDLAGWSATYEEPVSLTYAGRTVHKTGPWGQGPVFLQQLRLHEALGTGADAEAGRAGVLSAEFVHRVAEAAKLAFADREAWYADPAFADVPLADLLSPGYAAERAALVGAEASLELRPGSPGGRAPHLTEQRLTGTTPLPLGTSGEPTVDRAGEQRGDTCHLDVVDRHGNMVAATPSGGWLASSPVIPALGFPLGTRGQMFWLDPRSPSVIAPGKRPRTTLTPTLVTRDGEAVMAFGTPGGDQQDQWSLTYFLRLVHGGMGLQEAIDAPMFHTNGLPSSFYPREISPGQLVVESRLGEDAIAELRRRGHDVVVSDPWSLGRLSAVARDPETGVLRAAANPRGAQGYAAGR
ncbi:gamma-glutamyltransferase family protein [Streptomonospora nanhaiensis]|uniref:Gamma-glutamyltranspeptidase/glutathione hydrolase n=1 Tax=Streptomonospora nanhaiensis TaxID=1323731 RepID=A0A853BMP8_9ACTN|nr:gamma-glutamyltransferase family protein [Streptomonospora nanhaiensis]MBV2366674.1 gamma-glutamyltransferase family protein [Streptomonospora nanhaiensis]MBX9389973.1 gamma-glutamyltransferase family protein [Streptomonospora nanhaiensis]NYI95984.1 gamma-glutamyltranspeptidase/glutathione hydrolase [Streptomonospora nanhaiensis]